MSDAELRKDDGYIPARAMFIVAHPDDIEFGCAGTAARWKAGGAEVAYVLVTSGDVGIDEPGMTRERAAQIRETEQTEAAAEIGVTDVTFLREPDGTVVNTLDLRRRLVREIRRFKPEAVVTFDPTAMFISEAYVNHPDHRAVGVAAVDAVFPASGQPLVFSELEQEGLNAHKVRKLFVVSFNGPGSTVVDISDTLEDKLRSLRKHKSQLAEWDPEKTVREWASNAAKDTPHEFVESYRVVTMITDEEWEKRSVQRATESEPAIETEIESGVPI